MTQSADEVLRQATLYSDDRDYRILRLPSNAITLAAGILAEVGAPFTGLVADKDEVTLLLPDEAMAAFEARLRLAKKSEQKYRLITFDAQLQPDLVGFIARIAQALAAAGIPILTYAAFSRDHVLVPAGCVHRALLALRELQMESA
ncbi:MAG: ACT domain-containing protein [Chloroflexi bacterium]|nr:ACT domain-containing protein [Chloroflexota bacterium]